METYSVNIASGGTVSVVIVDAETHDEAAAVAEKMHGGVALCVTRKSTI